MAFINSKGDFYMTMKVYQADTGETVISGDDHLVQRAKTVDQSTPYVDVSRHRPGLDVLAGLYLKADASKRPEDAAAYVRHRDRISAMFRKRDVEGARYETGE